VTNYSTLEFAVVNKFLVNFSNELSEARCKAGEFDKVLDGIFSENAVYGVVLEFNGGHEDRNSPFGKLVWIWEISGLFLIQYTADVEERLRLVLDKLKLTFDGDHTLGGLTPKVSFSRIDPAEPVKINDTPFYWLTFTVEIIDR
jgi:hypothetical protein